MKKIQKTLKTLRGKLAIIAVAVAAVFTVDVAMDKELPKDQAMAAILAVLVLCLVPAVIMWITGWQFANEPLSRRWGKWEGKHELPNQQKRMRKAIEPLFDVISFDRDTGSAKFKDVMNGGRYHTNLLNCICDDYQKRHLPCPHMYYIAGELGLIDLYSALPKKKAAPAEDEVTEAVEE